jgi:hypothetical protein
MHVCRALGCERARRRHNDACGSSLLAPEACPSPLDLQSQVKPLITVSPPLP